MVVFSVHIFRPIFRSYKPIDDKLKENTIEDPQPVEGINKILLVLSHVNYIK